MLPPTLRGRILRKVVSVKMSSALPVVPSTCRVKDILKEMKISEVDNIIDQPSVTPSALMSVQVATGGTGTDLTEQEKHSRGLSAESQDFEFNKLMTDISLSPGNPELSNILGHHMLMNSAGRGLEQQLASADELFYKGQLLPLHYNTRFHCNNNTAAPPSPFLSSYELTPNISSSIKDQDVRFSSCRMDHAAAVALDDSLFAFTRCSSFKCHSTNQSSYYCNSYANYGTTSYCTPNYTRDSSSSSTSAAAADSSRDSNGSSQDSCSSSDNNRDHHIAANCCNGNNVYKRRHSFIQGWKVFWSGLKKGATFNASRNGKLADNSCHGSCKSKNTGINYHVHKIKSSAHQGAVPCVCTIKSNRHATNPSSVCPCHEKEKRVASCGVKKISSDDAKTYTNRYDQHMKEKNMKNGHSSWGSIWPLGQTKRTGPLKKMKATFGYGIVDSTEKDEVVLKKSQLSKEGWSGSMTCSPMLLERKLSQPSIHIPSLHVKLPSSRTFKFSTVSSSCPASVMSSPNHSGLLSPSFIANNISAMQELQSAVQGAIAHCKQSISPTCPSSADSTAHCR